MRNPEKRETFTSPTARNGRLPVILSIVVWVFGYLLIGHFTPAAADKQKMDSSDREAAERCVKHIEQLLKDDYYDRSFHGMDLKARAAEAIDRVHKAETLAQTYGIMAWMLEPLNDSHTYFLPPSRPYYVQNGWELGFVGEKCYILAVQTGSDAANQGVKPGDEVMSLEGYTVNRASLWKLEYAFGVLAPRSGMHMVLRTPDGQTRTLLVNAKVDKIHTIWGDFSPEKYVQEQDYKHASGSRVAQVGDGLMVWKLPVFAYDNEVDNYVRQARKQQKLILDLRNNPGGLQTTVSRLLASVFDHDIKVGERVERQGAKPWEVKSRGSDHAYTGKLVVLIDSKSASAAEIFARVVQIEKRAIVIGDRSAGKVMSARHEYFVAGNYSPFAAGLSVTIADIHMTDGKSLENVSVQPDVTVLPTAEDLMTGRDPALARGAADMGVTLTPEQAGKLFPAIWGS
jgi:C-terminal processing protease CtpA/Prc